MLWSQAAPMRCIVFGRTSSARWDNAANIDRATWATFCASETSLVSTAKRRKVTSSAGRSGRLYFVWILFYQESLYFTTLPEWSHKAIDELLESSDITLFKAALKIPDHVIHPLLPPPKAPGYNLRKRSHGLLLPTTQSNLLRKNFVYRMLFKHIY